MVDGLQEKKPKPKQEPVSAPKQQLAPKQNAKPLSGAKIQSGSKEQLQAANRKKIMAAGFAPNGLEHKVGKLESSSNESNATEKIKPQNEQMPESEQRKKASELFGTDLNKKVASEPSWLYATDAEKNGNFNYSDARKNGFKHPTTGKESSDLNFNNNYTGPGYSAFEGLQPMEDPNDFSQNFEESFHRFPSEEKGSRRRSMVGEQKFYEDADENVWDALREAKENASDTDTVRDIISRASKESGIDEDRLLNALIFQHLYFGNKFAFRPETNYKKLSAKQDEEYQKYLPPQWRKK